ncbi:uncharacterized protein LOC101456936 isoform X1 [Ceratitis capitata]|uniref:uncharacterized protein LOC101456936 isoform X1 n=1 Tax=Ceratitis capitata TaxID=7213 RepID=UPI000329FC01|nr:uncharacterized protein LOC101456936 isoform X1 [Ceratitis capitata]XP_012156639.1 uncharacterized protein LOC101456936 isoform X1 [Ceratitis capitata]XP_020714099.1 uncharacterized protein LOC101456936 isoform X1 [Ceratitis capitata]
MDSSKFYCINESQPSTLAGCNTSKEYGRCGSDNISNGNVCKEPSTPRNSSGKATSSNKGANGTLNNENESGNYINFMQMPLDALQYHRRKVNTQDYNQSRMYYNSPEYKLQDDIYADSGSERLCSGSSSTTFQMEGQHYANTMGNHMPQQHQSSNHIHSHSAQNSLVQMQLQHKPTNNSNPALDCNEETIEFCHRTDSKEQQTQESSLPQFNGNQNNNICEPVMSLTSPTTIDSCAGSSTSPGASTHMMYTVHRVVTTAQIQTAIGNTYASSSSISSVVSGLRNEDENMASPVNANITPLNENSGLNDINAAIILNNGMNKNEENSGNANGGVKNGSRVADSRHTQASGAATNFNPSSHAGQKYNYMDNNNSGSQSAASNNSNNMNVNGSKPSTLTSRPLQNVIPTCVYLMSRIAVHMEIEGTAQCPTQVMLAAALGCEELGIANKLLAQSIFALWMTSELLDIQLKSHHRPYAVRLAWQALLDRLSTGNSIDKKFDEPMIMLKRNVFFSKRDEEKIKDHRIVELLYEEAKYNVLSGRYVMEPVHALMLGGIQARIELGPYNPHAHTVGFLRENQLRFLPQHVAKSTSWSWLPVSRKNSAEVKLLEQFKRVPQTATTKKLMRKYLEFCWALPFYGAAFFQGQVEQPIRGLMSLVSHKDVEVNIAVNERGIFIIDPIECTLLLGLRYEDLSWDYARPSVSNDPECQTCIFIQFDAMENGIQVSKLMQIFSKQAGMIDALIAHFAENIMKQKMNGNIEDQYHEEPYPIQNSGNGVLCNKFYRLTLATFDEEDRCIGQTGSLSISY